MEGLFLRFDVTVVSQIPHIFARVITFLAAKHGFTILGWHVGFGGGALGARELVSVGRVGELLWSIGLKVVQPVAVGAVGHVDDLPLSRVVGPGVLLIFILIKRLLDGSQVGVASYCSLGVLGVVS